MHRLPHNLLIYALIFLLNDHNYPIPDYMSLSIDQNTSGGKLIGSIYFCPEKSWLDIRIFISGYQYLLLYSLASNRQSWPGMLTHHNIQATHREKIRYSEPQVVPAAYSAALCKNGRQRRTGSMSSASAE